MFKKMTKLEGWLTRSIGFSLMLLTARVIISGERTYLFLAWNLFLAVIPLLLSRQLTRLASLNFKAVLMLLSWLLFLPNAPYIITDIFHLRHRPPLPEWFDLLLFTSAAWNGLLLAIVSMLQVEAFLLRLYKSIVVNTFVVVSLLLTGFGIYFGRFLRFNSWDLLFNPFQLFSSLLARFRYPFDHPRTWGFTILFGLMLSVVYFTITSISGTLQRVPVREKM